MRISVLPAVVLVGLPLARAQFHDQGMTRPPVVRTDYAAADYGTVSRPLVIGPCIWENDCRNERTIFDRSNYWRQNWPCSACSPSAAVPHWSVIFNNEPRADNHNPGPPDVSLPRTPPSEGPMGFVTLHGEDNLPGEAIWRAHLVLSLLRNPNPVVGGIPFLGFGGFSSRSTHRPLGWLRPSGDDHPSILEFGERLWQAIPPTPIPGGTQPATLASYVWIAAEWGTSPKAVFLTLYHYNVQNSTPPDDPATYLFNWPITGSVFFPGADIVYVDAEDVDDYCGFDVPLLAHRQDVNYRIDTTALFECLDARQMFTEPMPDDDDIPVTQVLWANESSGLDGALWIDVHGQRMTAPGSISAIASADAAVYGRGTAEIAAALERECAALPGCAERAAIAAAGEEARLELPIDRQPSRPELLRSAGKLGAGGP